MGVETLLRAGDVVKEINETDGDKITLDEYETSGKKELTVWEDGEIKEQYQLVER